MELEEAVLYSYQAFCTTPGGLPKGMLLRERMGGGAPYAAWS